MAIWSALAAFFCDEKDLFYICIHFPAKKIIPFVLVSQAEAMEATEATVETASAALAAADNDDAAKKEDVSFIFGSPAFQNQPFAQLAPSLAGGGAGAEEAEGLV